MDDDFDLKRRLMDETAEKLHIYVRKLVKEKKRKQAQAFCEEKFPQIARTGFIKRLLSALIDRGTERIADSSASPQDTYAFVSNRLSEKMKVVGPQTETNPSDSVIISVGEGVKLQLQRKTSGDYECAVCVPANESSPESSFTDPDMPDGKEEAAPFEFPSDHLGSFCSAAEYVFDNAHDLKDWAKHECWDLWEKYEYIDYPKKDVYDKVPVYWWWAWLQNASEKDLSDLEFIKKLVARRGECLAYALPASKADRKTVLGAIKDTDYAITYASEELQNDRGFVLQALDANSYAFQYVLDKFKDDKKVALKAVSNVGSNLQYVSERLKGDQDVIDTALEQDMSNFRYASEAFRSNKEYVMRAVAERGKLLQVLPEQLRSDRQVVLSAVTSNGAALQYASAIFKNDREIVLTAVNNYGDALEYASDELRDDKEIVFAAVKNRWTSLEYASERLKADKETALFTISKDGEAWHNVSPELFSDLDIIKAALEADGYEIIESLLDSMLNNTDTVLCILEALSATPPDMDNYGEFADGTSEYYNIFRDAEDTFCDLVEGLTEKTLKSDHHLVNKICELAVSLDSAYYEEGANPYEDSHTRLPDRLKEYFEENGIPYSNIITDAIDSREAKKYHPKDYSEDISLEDSLFLEAGDYYEWLAEKIRNEEGHEAFADYLSPNGSWVFNVMERFVKSLIANWDGLFHDDELWRDDDYAVDLDKTYEEINKRLSTKMEVQRNAFEYYYSENVKVQVNEHILFKLVRELPLKILELWVNDYDTDRERGFWVAPDRLDVFCDLAEYVHDNYKDFEDRAKERASRILRSYSDAKNE
ncbi:MAG: DUF4116 domain-containing protein [Dehalococcoidales bacterium]|nr:DUF4116 domain-containing protein [Dehalococcoidales bacterium]